MIVIILLLGVILYAISVVVFGWALGSLAAAAVAYELFVMWCDAPAAPSSTPSTPSLPSQHPDYHPILKDEQQ